MPKRKMPTKPSSPNWTLSRPNGVHFAQLHNFLNQWRSRATEWDAHLTSSLKSLPRENRKYRIKQARRFLSKLEETHSSTAQYEVQSTLSELHQRLAPHIPLYYS